MKKDDILTQILGILRTAKEDESKLQKILDFLMDEIYEEPDDEMIIPEKYQKLVHDVADKIDAGLICFINPETLEIEQIPQGMADPKEYELNTGEAWNDSFNYESWNRYITVEPPESLIGFEIMEQFTNEVDDQKLQSRLIYALNHKKTFANFKYIVETSPRRQQWFAFKQRKLEECVWHQIQSDFQNEG